MIRVRYDSFVATFEHGARPPKRRIIMIIPYISIHFHTIFHTFPYYSQVKMSVWGANLLNCKISKPNFGTKPLANWSPNDLVPIISNNVDVQSVGDDMVKPWLSNVIQEGRTPPIRFVEHMMESNEQCPVG